MKSPRRNVHNALQAGSKVTLRYLGREVTGSVVEDRGPLGRGGSRLLTVQLDGSSADPFEVEVEESDLKPTARMSDHKRAALESYVEQADERHRVILDTALRMFRDELRHVSMGMWPDHLISKVSARTNGTLNPGTDEATEILDQLAELGVVVRRPSGIYVSTDWLLEYLDSTSLSVEWATDNTRTTQLLG